MLSKRSRLLVLMLLLLLLRLLQCQNLRHAQTPGIAGLTERLLHALAHKENVVQAARHAQAARPHNGLLQVKVGVPGEHQSPRERS